MKTTSASTLIVLSIGLILLGFITPAYGGQFLLFATACISALAPAVRGQGRWRVIGLLTLAVAIALTAMDYPRYRAGMHSYQDHWKP